MCAHVTAQPSRSNCRVALTGGGLIAGVVYGRMHAPAQPVHRDTICATGFAVPPPSQVRRHGIRKSRPPLARLGLSHVPLTDLHRRSARNLLLVVHTCMHASTDARLASPASAVQDLWNRAGRPAEVADGPGHRSRHELSAQLPTADRAPRSEVAEPAGGQRLHGQGATSATVAVQKPALTTYDNRDRAVAMHTIRLSAAAPWFSASCGRGSRPQIDHLTTVGRDAGLRLWSVTGPAVDLAELEESGRHAGVVRLHKQTLRCYAQAYRPFRVEPRSCLASPHCTDRRDSIYTAAAHNQVCAGGTAEPELQ